LLEAAKFIGAILLLGALGQAIIDNLPLLLEAAIRIISELAKDLAKELPTLIPTIVKMVMDLVQMLVDNAPLLLDAAMNFAWMNFAVSGKILSRKIQRL
jgi:hypothetical protein